MLAAYWICAIELTVAFAAWAANAEPPKAGPARVDVSHPLADFRPQFVPGTATALAWRPEPSESRVPPSITEQLPPGIKQLRFPPDHGAPPHEE
jgi:hypothetical protein